MTSVPDNKNDTRELENTCFKYGYLLAQSFKASDINKCLYTLLEQGIYSFFLLLRNIEKKNEERYEDQLKDRLIGYCKSNYGVNFDNGQKDKDEVVQKIHEYQWLITINQNLSALIFSENILKKILIYARYSVDKDAS